MNLSAAAVLIAASATATERCARAVTLCAVKCSMHLREKPVRSMSAAETERAINHVANAVNCHAA